MAKPPRDRPYVGDPVVLRGKAITGVLRDVNETTFWCRVDWDVPKTGFQICHLFELEKIAMVDKILVKSDAPSLQLSAEKDGKIVVRGYQIDGERAVVLAGEYLEIRWVDGMVCATTRKIPKPTEQEDFHDAAGHHDQARD